MQKALVVKALLVVAILIALVVPLKMIEGPVAERAARRQAVLNELASQSYARQIVAGPVLTLPYIEEYDEDVQRRDSKTIERRRVSRVVYLFAATNTIDGDASVEIKARGLFRARVFNWRSAWRGEFVIEPASHIVRSRPESRIRLEKPTISVLIADPRGLVETPTVVVEGQALVVERGSALRGVVDGVHASLPELDADTPQRIRYAITVALRGTESLAVVPLAGEERARLAANWPHASFGGQFLPQPESLQRSTDGFEARWSVTALASTAQRQIAASIDGRSDAGFRCAADACADRFEVRFFEPIDIYSVSERAVKYGFLFVAFTFGCFAVFELLKRLPIHPAQYLLVGLALAAFFLLLFALSEHIAFAASYAVAASACIALIGFYLRSALGSVRRGLAFATLLAILYAALYGLLVSEDNALLLGAVLVFAAIAAAMIVTRNFDWYALTFRDARGAPR